MKRLSLLFLLAAVSPAFGQAMNADDVKWINQCIGDNQGEPGGTPQIIRAYCVCMNEKMSSNETRSITQWEKANPNERRDCERKSGWR